MKNKVFDPLMGRCLPAGYGERLKYKFRYEFKYNYNSEYNYNDINN